ncbi:MAG: SDR family NAD(P)-dependent oxidoreductase [Gammaproteobacteria bacterium]|nr:SDR family NAD(P)-dependent oxidoreductase [Gammaproteobacteria bacterium]
MLDGKVALITGAGRGIGRDIALSMADQGAKVIVNDLGSGADGDGEDAAPASQVVAEINAAGGAAVANFGSVSDRNDANSMIEQALDEFGAIDVIVNNAGILRDAIFHKMTEQEWDTVIDVHLTGSFNTAHAAAGHFRKQESGCFINFTSTSGLIGNFGQANYSAAKMGIVGLSKSLALDMARFNVRSNCIAPFAWSRLIGSIPITNEAEKARVERIKEMTPAKIAPLCVALAAPDCDVSGQIFCVRNNEIFLMSQPRPIRSVHRGEGWTPETIRDQALPSLKASFYDLDRSSDIFTWDPV